MAATLSMHPSQDTVHTALLQQKALALMGWLVWNPPVSSCRVSPLTEPLMAEATACSASTCKPYAGTPLAPPLGDTSTLKGTQVCGEGRRTELVSSPGSCGGSR